MAFELDAGVRQQFLDTFNQGTNGVFKSNRMAKILDSVQQGIQHVDAGTSAYAMGQSTLNLINNVISKGGSKKQLEALREFIGSGNSALSSVDASWLKNPNGDEFTGVDSVIERINNRIDKIDANEAKRIQAQQEARATKARNQRIQSSIDRMNDPEVQATNRRLRAEAGTKRIWREDGSSYRVSNLTDMNDLKTDLMVKHYDDTRTKPTPIGVSHSDRAPIDMPEGSQYQKGSREYYKARHERRHGSSSRPQTLDQEGVDAVVNRVKTEQANAAAEKAHQDAVVNEYGHAINDDMPQVGRGRRDSSLPPIREGHSSHGRTARQIEKAQRKINKANGGYVHGTEDELGHMARDQANNADLDALNDLAPDGSKLSESRRLTDVDKIISEAGPAGSVKRMSTLRNQYGREASRATKEFNAGVDRIMKKATQMRGPNDSTPIADFIRNNEELSREYAELQNTTFARTRKLGDALNTSMEDLASIEGHKVPNLSAKDKAIMANAQNGYGGAASEIRDAQTTFVRDVVDENGVKKQYQYEKNSTFTRGVNEDGSWGATDVSETMGRRVLTTDADGKTVLGELEKVEAKDYDEAFKVASNTEGAVKTTVSQARHVDANGNAIKIGHMENLGDSANVSRLAKSYDKSDVAARIAKTGPAQDSGILKQIGEMAGKHPGIAAAIAIGGFALANKALDSRREYD